MKPPRSTRKKDTNKASDVKQEDPYRFGSTTDDDDVRKWSLVFVVLNIYVQSHVKRWPILLLRDDFCRYFTYQKVNVKNKYIYMSTFQKKIGVILLHIVIEKMPKDLK